MSTTTNNNHASSSTADSRPPDYAVPSSQHDNNDSDDDAISFTMMDPDQFQSLLFPLFKCGVCRNILRDPVTLQCGNTLCRTCVPGTSPSELQSSNVIGEEMADSDLTPPGQSSLRANSGFPAFYWSTPTDEKWVPPTMRERFDCPFE